MVGIPQGVYGSIYTRVGIPQGGICPYVYPCVYLRVWYMPVCTPVYLRVWYMPVCDTSWYTLVYMPVCDTSWYTRVYIREVLSLLCLLGVY